MQKRPSATCPDPVITRAITGARSTVVGIEVFGPFENAIPDRATAFDLHTRGLAHYLCFRPAGPR